MDILKDIISIGFIISTALTILARVIPNEKIYGFGSKLGQMLSVFGTARLGSVWRKIEEFLINSSVQFFAGMKNGLEMDDDLIVGFVPPEEEEAPKPKVRK